MSALVGGQRRSGKAKNRSEQTAKEKGQARDGENNFAN